MELYQVKSFIAVARSQNLTRAARETHQSPSAVSSQIKALEAEFGVTLFKRTTRGMVLSSEGESLLASAKTLVQAAKEMETRAGGLSRTKILDLNIGINTDPAYLKLSDLSQKIQSAVPGLRLTYVETQTFSTPDRLKSGEIDLGFHFGGFEDSDVRSRRITTATIRVVLPMALGKTKEKAPLKELVDLPWIWTRYPCPFHIEFNQRLDKEGLTLKATADAVDENIVEELVKSGTGAALMREDQAQRLVDKGHALFWEDPGMTVPLCLACLEKRQSDPHIAAVFNTLKQIFP